MCRTPWSHLEYGSEADPVFGSHLEGSSILLAPSCFLDFISLDFDEESMIPSVICLDHPKETPTSSLSFLCGWPIYGCVICSAGKAFAPNKHNMFSSLASSFFSNPIGIQNTWFLFEPGSQDDKLKKNGWKDSSSSLIILFGEFKWKCCSQKLTIFWDSNKWREEFHLIMFILFFWSLLTIRTFKIGKLK